MEMGARCRVRSRADCSAAVRAQTETSAHQQRARKYSRTNQHWDESHQRTDAHVAPGVHERFGVLTPYISDRTAHIGFDIRRVRSRCTINRIRVWTLEPDSPCGRGRATSTTRQNACPRTRAHFNRVARAHVPDSRLHSSKLCSSGVCSRIRKRDAHLRVAERPEDSRAASLAPTARSRCRECQSCRQRAA